MMNLLIRRLEQKLSYDAPHSWILRKSSWQPYLDFTYAMGRRDKVDPIFCGLDEMVGRPDLLNGNGMGDVEPRGRGRGANVRITV